MDQQVAHCSRTPPLRLHLRVRVRGWVWDSTCPSDPVECGRKLGAYLLGALGSRPDRLRASRREVLGQPGPSGSAVTRLPAGCAVMSRRAVGLLVVVLIVAGGGAWLLFASEGEERFCTAALSYVEVDGLHYATQDQGEPGRDGCDGTDFNASTLGGLMQQGYVGFDCKLHDNPSAPPGTFMEPNRADGTCGQRTGETTE